MSVSNNKTSLLISSQVPSFVRDDHEAFMEFLTSYYKFLEQEGQMLNTSKTFIDKKNIDLSDGIYVQKLYDE